MVQDQALLSGLSAFNAVLYGLLVVGILRRRGSRTIVSNLTEAFTLLETALKYRFPDLPPGFTWREALSMIRESKLEVDWKNLEGVLRGYEAHRYGGLELESTDPGEVLRLASKLGKGGRFVRRS